MINWLNLQNFKAWQALDIEFGQVTGLFGTNSSGKSSLIQFLLMLKQTKNTTDRNIVLDLGNPDKFIDLGTYKDVIHQHQDTETLSYTLDWQIKTPLKISDPSKSRKTILFQGESLGIFCEVALKQQAMAVNHLSYGFNEVDFCIEPETDDLSAYRLFIDSENTDSEFDFVRTKGRDWALPKPLKTHLFPDQAKTYYQNAEFLGEFESEYEALMDNIHYLGPLREHPKRNYQWSGSSPESVGVRGELTVEAILSATRAKEVRNLGKETLDKPFEEVIAYWLKQMGLIDAFSIGEIAPGANLYQTKVRKEAGGSEVLLTDVGFGVSQVLPVIVLLYYVPTGSTVLFEQPEIHLHPAVQSHLADLMLNVAKSRNLQVVVESHSEHFLRRLQRRVAEQQAEADDIRLYFCSTVKGKAKLSALALDQYGQIDNWPENFFGDEMAEISATRRAMLMRKKR